MSVLYVTDLLDLEDIGAAMKRQKSKEKKEKDAADRQAARDGGREMVTKLQRRALTKEGYRIIGTHSAVKLCRWTKVRQSSLLTTDVFSSIPFMIILFCILPLFLLHLLLLLHRHFLRLHILPPIIGHQFHHPLHLYLFLPLPSLPITFFILNLTHIKLR
jgi:hypothetical protein